MVHHSFNMGKTFTPGIFDGFWTWLSISSVTFDVETEHVFTVYILFMWYVPKKMRVKTIASLERKFKENNETATIIYE